MGEEIDCRICLNHTPNSEQLIQPCKCYSSYVHESCLQRWRQENIRNDKYNQCEICHANYIIHRNVPKENFLIKITYANRNHFVRGQYGERDNNIPFIFPFYLLTLSTTFISYFADELLNKNSIYFFIGEKKNQLFIKELNMLPMGWVIYYSGLSVYLLSSSILLSMLCMPICKINRKSKYYKQMLYSYIGYIFYIMCYPINIIISYRIMGWISTFVLVNIMYFFTSYFATYIFLESHNKNILLLNRDIAENILSFNYSELETIGIHDSVSEESICDILEEGISKENK
jgi:hypothetical protein